MRKWTGVFFLLVVPVLCLAGSQKGYYRFPTLHGDTVVFTAEGDLWRVGIGESTARRLTTHLGMESHPSISPDGRLVAFSAEYEGPTEVYTMPIDGGLPTRWTFEGEEARVVGWTRDGRILYSTRHYSTLPNTQVAVIDIRDRSQTLVPLSQASEGVFDPTGRTFFFTRLPFQGSRTKRYRGGTVQNIWKYEKGSEEAAPLTADYPGTSKEPMWWEGRIYFLSDRDGTMNIWSMDEDGGRLRQHTFHKGWDAQSPDLQGGRIVYQLGADLHLYDIASGEDLVLDISLASDFDQTREKWIDEPMEYLSAVHLSPGGEKIVLTSRGRVFVAPTKEGRFVEVTRKQGVRYRNARFFPDGKKLLLLSDETGEQEFWTFPADGVGEGIRLTRDADVLRFEGIPSPDRRKIAFTDKNHRLWIFDLESKEQTLVADTNARGNYQGLSWSPDSRWLAYAAAAPNFNLRILLYKVEDGRKVVLTSDRVDSYNPVWSPDGKWLYFLSDRHFRSLVGSPWGPRQPEPFLDKTTKLYVVSLREGQHFPFRPPVEIPQPAGDGEEQEEPSGRKEKDVPGKEAVHIDLDGLRARVMEVPVPPGNIARLSLNRKRLFWMEKETSFDHTRNLVALDIDGPRAKPKTIAKDIRNYELSMDGSALLVQKRRDLYVIDSSSGESVKLEPGKVDLSGWKFSVIPREEWRQMFIDAWRLERDYFYDRNLHGVDWEGLLRRHLPLVDRVADRSELNDLIAQLVGELSALHIFVRGGDIREGKDRVSPASLGAVLRKDEKAGGYRVEHIFRSDPDYLDRLSPLARPGVGVREGDVILAVNGVPVLSVDHPRRLLRNQAHKQVLLKMKAGESGKTFDTVVEPITPSEEANLRYDEWEYTRRLRVEEMSNGTIGYVHLRAMGGGNYTEWVKNYYPVFDRQGLIIDMRHNRGGNIDSWILEKLLRRAWFYWQSRVGKPYWNMQYAFRGHMVVLCNERTASDGEAFTEGFRRLGLGKVIGTRTWGGEIWLSFDNRLVDRGIASAAQTGVYGPEGEWLIEGHGVDPDIVVDNLPHATFLGQDAQLEAAVKHLQEKIAQDPRPVPPPPPYPKKAFDYGKRDIRE